MPTKPKSQNAINAILHEYQKVVDELSNTITNVTDEQLSIILDAETGDPDCRSIQSILTHVCLAGYGYAVRIERHLGADKPYRKQLNCHTIADYQQELQAMMAYNRNAFSNIFDHQIDAVEEDKKILTSWKQRYDIEQLMEHAIVHVLRHRYQIEKFMMKL